MAVSALPSNALYDVQRYLRQKRATGAQVTPQNERAAWSGYFDTMESNSLNERNFALRNSIESQRMKLAKEAQENEEGAASIAGVGQLVSTVGQGAMLLKGTSLGAKMGLGPATVAPGAAPGAVSSGVTASSIGGTSPTLSAYSTGARELAATTSGAAPTTAGAVSASAPTGAAYSTGAAELAGTEAAAVGAESGLMTAATPYLGPAGYGFAAGSIIPHMLGFNKGKGELAAGVAAGGIAGGIAGGFTLGASAMSWSGPGAIVGGIIGAVAGGIGAKVK